MVKSIKKVIPKRRPGRPATGKDPARAFRLSDEFMERVDAWAADQDDQPGRSEAIRRLVDVGLTVKAPQRSSDKQKVRAKELAGTAIDNLTEAATTADDKATRKRRLIKGPEEFREARVDRPKRKS